MKIAPIDERVLGVKIRYDDGRIERIPVAELATSWIAGSGVQVVSIYDNEPRGGKYYAQWFASYDLYGYSPSMQAIIETNRPSDLPPDAVVKTGSLMDKADFMALYNAVMQERW